MSFASMFLLAAVLSLIALAIVAELYLIDEETLVDEIQELEMGVMREPLSPSVVLECNRKIEEILSSINLSEESQIQFLENGREVFLVAVVGEDLLCEKRFMVAYGMFYKNPRENVTVWVRVSESALDEVHQLTLSGNFTPGDVSGRALDYLVDGRVRLHPYSRVADIADQIRGVA